MKLNTRQVVRAGVFFVLVLMVSVPLYGSGPRFGEAVVVNQAGGATVQLIDGPVHEGRRRDAALYEGGSVGETALLRTDHNGQLCILLSPGATLCVAPNSALTFERLRQTAAGLPRREEDLIRRIHILLHRGRIMLHASPPTGSLDLRVITDAGQIHAGGGTFSVAGQEDGSWAVFNEAYEQQVIPDGGKPLMISEKSTARLARNGDGSAEAGMDETLGTSQLRAFEVCGVFFNDLAQFYQDPLRFDRQGLATYIGGSEAKINFLGEDAAVMDVSPSLRSTTLANERPAVPAEGEPGGGGRWGEHRIWDWYQSIGTVKGINYVPRNAVNSVEMWSEESFNRDIIEEELGWAQNAGYTSVRVQLQYVTWEADPEGFIERMDDFLEIAGSKGMRVVPVLFDDLNLAGADPRPGPQSAPEPGIHNSRWVPSPGREAVVDRSEWPELQNYVKSVMQEFRRDKNILFWDLYNMPGAGPEFEESLPLMDQAFLWARAVDPRHPIAVSAWTRFGSAMSSRKLERSDLVTFQSFDAPEQVEALLMLLRRFDRPIICTDWLMRQRGNDFESMLPVYAVNQVGWFNRGLVNGRTQKWIQQPAYRSDDDPDLWQHDVFRADGTAYNPHEVEMIKAFRFVETGR